MRNPLPASAAVVGSLLGAASLNWFSAMSSPRLLTSRKIRWLPRVRFTGRRMTTGVEVLDHAAAVAGSEVDVDDERVLGIVRIDLAGGAADQLFVGPTWPNDMPSKVGDSVREMTSDVIRA